MSATLASCSHKCAFSTAWSNDAESHWHVCTNEDCEEIADKADHTWDEGIITTKATQESDGIKTFTCTVCSLTKTETVAFTGLSEEDWNAAFSSAVFENFTYKEIATVYGGGVPIDTETIYKFTKDNAWVKVTIADQAQESYAPDKASSDTARQQLVNSLKDITPYANFQYDAATKTYKATTAIYIASLNTSTSDITLTFADSKLVEIKYSASATANNVSYTATATVTLSDYGTVVLIPAT